VVLPAEVKCCGFGGDRGFVVPELNAHALRKLHADVPAGCCGGYSSNQTCEIGLTHATGLPYRSIVHLLDECSEEAAPGHLLTLQETRQPSVARINSMHQRAEGD
jgi:D-lactate dehydrogenase